MNGILIFYYGGKKKVPEHNRLTRSERMIAKSKEQVKKGIVPIKLVRKIEPETEAMKRLQELAKTKPSHTNPRSVMVFN